MRLDRCALTLPKWAKIHEILGKRAWGTLKIVDHVADATVRVENAHKNRQVPHSTKLLGKYRIKHPAQMRRVFLYLERKIYSMSLKSGNRF